MVKSLSKVYFSLLIFSPFIPQLNAADVIAMDYIALNITAIFGILILISSGKLDFKHNLRFKLPLLLLFLFLVVSTLSIFFSINKVTSFVSLIKLFVIVVHLYLIYALKIYKIISVNFILTSCSIFLLLEVFESMYPLFNEILPVRKYEYRFSTYLIGITGNRNITAASIVLKIPLVLIYLFRVKKLLSRLILGSIIAFAVACLFFLSSRAGLLSLSLILIVFFLNTLIQLVKEKDIILFFKRNLLLTISIATSFIFFNSNIADNDRSSIQSRVSSISSTDESATQRLRFYGQAINYFLQNPYTPVGLGNWKLYSIKLDKDRINSYIVPYVVHNDFLEILVETSLLGVVFYSGFFLVLFFMIYGLYFKQKEFEDKTEILLLGTALISYLVDANLNFPLYRPIMQVNLLLIITLILNLYNFNFFRNEKNT